VLLKTKIGNVLPETKISDVLKRQGKCTIFQKSEPVGSINQAGPGINKASVHSSLRKPQFFNSRHQQRIQVNISGQWSRFLKVEIGIAEKLLPQKHTHMKDS
jgi:hypothetical protein